MSQAAGKLRDQIKQFPTGGIEIKSGTVVPGSVDLQEYTCSVLLTDTDEGGAPMPGVMLSAVTENANGLIIVPADGSNVVIASIDAPGEYTIIKASDLVTVLLTGDIQVVFHGGENGGIPLSPNLVQRLNRLENIVNELISKYNSHTHTGVQTGGGTSGPTLAQETNTATLTQQGDIENTKIKQ